MRAAILSMLLCGLVPSVHAAEPAKVAGPFNPQENVAAAFKAAKAEARKSGRKILVDVGGNWCPWCRRLHAFWDEQPGLKQVRDAHYVFLMVNYSPENKNEAFLKRYPKIPGYPHFFVLDAEGVLLQSQDTGVLEQGEGYSPAKIQEFLLKWK